MRPHTKLLTATLVLIVIGFCAALFLLDRPATEPHVEPVARARTRHAQVAPESTSEPVRREVRAPLPPTSPVESEPEAASGAAALSMPPSEVASRSATRRYALEFNGTLGSPLEGKYVILLSALEKELAQSVLAAADHTFELTLEHLGIGVPNEPPPTGLKHQIFVVSRDQYRALAPWVSDADDAAKAWNYDCFCAADDNHLAHGVVERLANDDDVKHRTMQTAAELALRDRVRGKRLPRWFLEGVACFEGRFFDAVAAKASVAALRADGDLVPLEGLFRNFTPSPRTVLQAGLLIAFLRDGKAEDLLADAHRRLLRSLREQGRDTMWQASRLLEQTLELNEPRVLAFMRE